MKERELIQYAGLAIGQIGSWRDNGFWAGIVGRGWNAIDCPWNPISDSGDALHLAAKLRMEIDISEAGVAIRVPQGRKVLVNFDGQRSEREVVQLAITRAAAEIGKTMGAV